MKIRFLFPAFLLAACSHLAETSPPPNAEQQRLMALAADMRAKGDEDTAMVMLDQAADASSGNTDAHRELAKIYLKRGKPLSAIDILEDGLKIQPLNPVLRNQYGLALDRAGRHADAQVEYRRALELKPNDAPYQNNLAYSLIADGKADQAVKLLEPLAAPPDAPATLRGNLALAYGMVGRNDDAKALLLRDMPPEKAAQDMARFAYLREHPDALFKAQTEAVPTEPDEAKDESAPMRD